MPVAHTSGWSEALKLKSALKDENIEAFITVGGLSVQIDPDQWESTSLICKNYGAKLDEFPDDRSILERDVDGIPIDEQIGYLKRRISHMQLDIDDWGRCREKVEKLKQLLADRQYRM